MLDGRVTVVTGAEGGLGRAIVDTFDRYGAVLYPVDLAGEGCFHHDLSSAEGNREMIEGCIDRHGRIDVLILNAGLQFVSPIAEFPEEQWDRVFDVLVKGPFLALKYAWPTLTAEPGRRVIVTASSSSTVAAVNKAAYVAAKHAVSGLVKVAALEGAEAGLTVNAVAPGWMNTPMAERQVAARVESSGLSREQVIERMVANPGNRFIETEEVAELMAFLAGPGAGGLNGACVPVDLGSLIVEGGE